jgi:Zn-finger nucleic acid-binding protein
MTELISERAPGVLPISRGRRTDGGKCPRCGADLKLTLLGRACVSRCMQGHGDFVRGEQIVPLLGESANPRIWFTEKAMTFGAVQSERCPGGHSGLAMYSIRAPDGETMNQEICLTCGGIWLNPGDGLKLSRIGTKLSAPTPTPPKFRDSRLYFAALSLFSLWWSFDVYTNGYSCNYDGWRPTPLLVSHLCSIIGSRLTALLPFSLSILLLYIAIVKK